MKSVRIVATVALAAAAVVAGCSIHAKPDKKTKQVMEEGFKGKDSMSARIAQGQGSDADFLKMVELTRQLALNRPPKGDLLSWRNKTDALYAAAVNLTAHKPGAVDAWKAAVNCKECHSVHKPDAAPKAAPAPAVAAPDPKADAKAK